MNAGLSKQLQLAHFGEARGGPCPRIVSAANDVTASLVELEDHPAPQLHSSSETPALARGASSRIARRRGVAQRGGCPASAAFAPHRRISVERDLSQAGSDQQGAAGASAVIGSAMRRLKFATTPRVRSLSSRYARMRWPPCLPVTAGKICHSSVNGSAPAALLPSLTS